MKKWKISVPGIEVLKRMVDICPAKLFVCKKNNPPLGYIYVRGTHGDWILLSWDYFDVEFKFEIYCMMIEECQVPPPMGNLTEIGSIPKFQSIKFLLRTEWVRPTKPGEVPNDYEHVIQEGGLAKLAPSSATAIGSVVYGVAFLDSDNGPILVVSVSEKIRYSLQIIDSPFDMTQLFNSSDSYDLFELSKLEADSN